MPERISPPDYFGYLPNNTPSLQAGQPSVVHNYYNAPVQAAGSAEMAAELAQIKMVMLALGVGLALGMLIILMSKRK